VDPSTNTRTRASRNIAAPVTSTFAKSASLAERAYLLVREKILKGELRLGAALSRRKVASELGMSLLPVSEAFQRLTSEGLLECKPRVGTRVCLPSLDDIQERYLLREALECQAARLFSQKATPTERRELRRMAERSDLLFDRRRASPDDFGLNYEAQAYHLQLHMRIAECSRCRLIAKLIEQTHILVFNWMFDIAARRVWMPPRTHCKLAEVLVGTDPEKSDAAMRAHIREGGDRILHLFDPPSIDPSHGA
jgi:GntR family transcriptional regulator, rspAB operon transcriptional repressor